MTLDEAIIHCEIVAKSNEKLAEFYYKDPGKNQKSGDACQECAAEHRQLAEWLRDYKRLKEREPCEDAISRQAVLDRIIESIETYHNQYTTDMLNMWGLFTQFIKDMPSVTSQSKTYVLGKIRAEIIDTLYVDSLIFGELIDFKNGKISADDVIEEFNRVTKMEILHIIDKTESEEE